MRNFSKKIAIAAIPAVMALSAPTAESKILIMSQEGWEVSFDGAANTFFAVEHTDALSIHHGGATTFPALEIMSGTAGTADVNSNEVGMITGLLPNVWGMTLKAPTTNGLDMQARLGLYTHMEGIDNGLGDGSINIRETNFQVTGSFGTVMFGRGIGIFGTNAIVNDMTLFGVGAIIGGAGNQGGTSLGRIGLGYLYTDFKPQIAWTTPGLGPIGAKIAIIDGAKLTDTAGTSDATEVNTPGIEAQLTYDVALGDLSANLWLDGTYQSVDLTNTAQLQREAAQQDDDSVTKAGGSFGTKLTYQNFSLVATGFYGQALGIRAQNDDSLDTKGKEVNTYGGYIQATADLGGGTNVGYSYGSNHRVQTGVERSTSTTAQIAYRDMHTGMIWHNVNDNFRLVAEGGVLRDAYHSNGTKDGQYYTVGGFFFW